jgi:Kelch motif
MMEVLAPRQLRVSFACESVPFASAESEAMWEAVAPSHVGRAKHAAVRLSDGRVLVVGGMSDEPKATFSKTAEVYDPAADRWTRIASIPEGAIGQALATLADGRLRMVRARALSLLLFAGRCGVPASNPMGALELCDL